MNEEQVRQIVNDAIRDHEVRVAAISSVMGVLLLAGTWHAIMLLR